MDFFKGEFITILDESHITVPQLRGMYEGDRSRKETLVKYGFRLPSALDNRPLNFYEINERFEKVLYVSATPSPYEVRDADHNVAELLVRPTGLLDPVLEPRMADSPVEDMLPDIREEIKKNNRVLITTLTKKMSEKLADYLGGEGIRCTYLHSEIKSLDRIKILKKLRSGDIDVLIGINLLREGLDLPEVSLVIILDADREGFLRTETSLIQTFGRAARHQDGRVILYHREYNKSLKNAINESQRRRDHQVKYNRDHRIRPVSIQKGIKDFYDDDYWIRKSDEVMDDRFTSRESVIREIEKLTVLMKKKAENLDFKEAARIKKMVIQLKNLQLEMF
jgi:excinuclease ABC subunit B